MSRMPQDTPFYIETERSPEDHTVYYQIHRVGDGRICTVYSFGYARKIVDEMNRAYRERVATMLLSGVTEKT